jgi:hypothetical protein
MACNSCETNFQGSQTLVVSVAKSGSRAVLSGRNIVLIRYCAYRSPVVVAPPLCIYARHRTVSPGCTLPLTWNPVS